MMPGWLMVIVGLVQLLLVGLVLSIVLMTWITIHRLRHPPRRTYSWALGRGVPGDPSELDEARAFETVELSLDGLSTRAWVIPGDGPDGPLVVCTPGWGDSKIGVLPRLDALLADASRVVAWDPPGHGEASGVWDFGLHTTVQLLELIRTLRMNEGERVVLFGWSMGAGVSIACAARDSRDGLGLVSGVIAEAPYVMPWTPAYRVLRLSGLPWRVNGALAFGLLGIAKGVGPGWRRERDGLPVFDRAGLAAHMDQPLRILHPELDEVCPLEDARAICEEAHDCELSIIKNGGHNTLWTAPETRDVCIETVGEFLREMSAGVVTARG